MTALHIFLLLGACVALSVGARRKKRQDCPEDMPVVMCFANPCTGATCTAVPGAKCTVNFCGACSREWTDENGYDVTTDCEDKD